MSVILRNHPSTLSSSTGIEDGFPPGDVEILEVKVNNNKILVSWKDPDNTVIDNTTLATWAGTILVRNDDHYPSSIGDGIIIVDSTTMNQFSNTPLEDDGLETDHTYYYRFFPYSTEGVYNNSGNLVFNATPVYISPIFSDNTWEQIIAASNSNLVPDTWNVGDEISMQLSGIYNMNIMLQIWDFNHFEKSDGSGKAHLLLGCKNVPFSDMMNTDGYNNGGWISSYASLTIMENIYNSMPDIIKSEIKEVTVEYDNGYNNRNSIKTMPDKIFIPGAREVGTAYGPNFGTRFPIFSDDNSRAKSTDWWTRSSTPSFSSDFFVIRYDGSCTSLQAHNSFGMLFCFNI